MFEPGGGPTIGPGSKKQQLLASAEKGVSCRTLSKITSSLRLKIIPNPLRNTSLSRANSGLQANPNRGPKLCQSELYNRSRFLQAVSGAPGPQTNPLITP